MKIFRHLTASLTTFSAMVAGGAFAFVVALTFVVSVFRDVEISAWNVVASQIGPWFLLFMGVYAIHVMLPIAVAHGRTRREFLVAASGFSVVLALVMTAVEWLGFLAEGGIYSLMDWRADEHSTQLTYLLMYLVWIAVGMLCAAAFDRFGAGGILVLPVALALVVATRVQLPGSGNLPFLDEIPDALGPEWYLLLAVSFVVALAGTWAIARDMPIRTRT
ncbi:hypothetical protein OG205_00530 [Lentzea sp. NBC_00516]|uniref:hypothetical protein n=1 Tax=Lentzea sp. NBC_00516 TaxID=2903582 RepID=UPI002E80E98E|nr:hypothetical protein [Lentzea sp. NBC_00516]WUD25517.1 hypothetical protein OG205_00530 [Lentzea sp. NBC_00516]